MSNVDERRSARPAAQVLVATANRKVDAELIEWSRYDADGVTQIPDREGTRRMHDLVDARGIGDEC